MCVKSAANWVVLRVLSLHLKWTMRSNNDLFLSVWLGIQFDFSLNFSLNYLNIKVCFDQTFYDQIFNTLFVSFSSLLLKQNLQKSIEKYKNKISSDIQTVFLSILNVWNSTIFLWIVNHSKSSTEDYSHERQTEEKLVLIFTE